MTVSTECPEGGAGLSVGTMRLWDALRGGGADRPGQAFGRAMSKRAKRLAALMGGGYFLAVIATYNYLPFWYAALTDWVLLVSIFAVGAIASNLTKDEDAADSKKGGPRRFWE